MGGLHNIRSMARALGISQAVLRELADAGKVPNFRVGSGYFFSGPAVAEALETLAAKQVAPARPVVAGGTADAAPVAVAETGGK